MTPEQYKQEQDGRLSAVEYQETKQRARTLIKRARDARDEVSEYTNKAIARRYNQTVGMVSAMRNGHEPVKMPALVQRKIRLDLMRYDELRQEYQSLNQIADALGVGRSVIRRWSREFGLANEGQEQKRKPRPAKPVELLWPGTPVGRFMVMRLTANSGSVHTYY